MDFGCGKGAFIKDILSINPTLKITGADISQTAITAARKKLPKQKFYILTEGGKSFKVIDPIGYKPFFPNFNQAKAEDLSFIDDMSNMIP